LFFYDVSDQILYYIQLEILCKMFGLGGKNKVAKGNNWRKLEDEAKNLKMLKGMKVETQKISKRTRQRPDVVAINPHDSRDRIVVDAKCVREINTSNINQVKGYKKTFFAKKGFILTCEDTKVTHKKRREAKDAKVGIKRGKTKRKKGLFG